MSRLWYRRPAAEWEEALPVGNGRMGAMVFGGVDCEHFQLCEETMWYGGFVDRNNPDMRENLPEIRRLLAEGELERAQRLILDVMTGCPQGMHPRQMLGDVWLDFEETKEGTGIPGEDPNLTQFERTGAADRNAAGAYLRCLDLDTAIATVRYEAGGTVYTREAFLSHPADCLAVRLTAEGAGRISFSAHMGRGYAFDGVKKWRDDGICLYGNLGKDGAAFAMMLRAKAEGGVCRLVGETLQVRDAEAVTLFFTSDTGHHHAGAAQPGGRAELACQTGCEGASQVCLQEHMDRVLTDAMEKGYEKLRQEHIRDYRSLYGRAELEIVSDPERDKELEELPTDERLLRVRRCAAEDGGDGSGADVGLEAMLFSFGRYLLISSSRPGGLPATLQGVWNRDLDPPWGDKYTININTEMNYWPAEHCNLSECQEPLFDLILKMVPRGRRTAREMYGCRGFVAHHNTDMHGDCAPQDRWLPGTYWPMGAAWLCTHIWNRYEYTLDREFLRRMFPALAEACLFFVDFLTEREGYLVTSPSVSPENSYRLPNGQVGAVCEGPSMDSQILRDLFDACLRAYEILGEEAELFAEDAGDGAEPDAVGGALTAGELAEKLSRMRKKLIPIRIGSDGRIMEWMREYEEPEPGHRHISHLYALFPSRQITVDETPELARAAGRTLEYRLAHGGGHTGWSRAWILNHYARLRDGEKAHESIVRMLADSTYPNLFDRHPPFQIDGNFGACAAIGHMLVWSGEKRVCLLPALPAAWRSGRVAGLRLTGNAEIEIAWEEHELKSAVIRADSDYEAVVRYGEREAAVRLKAGESAELFA